MSADITPDTRNQRMKEFMQVLPLTVVLAGLPECPPDKIFTPDQLDFRITMIRNAYKLSRKMLREIAEEGS